MTVLEFFLWPFDIISYLGTGPLIFIVCMTVLFRRSRPPVRNSQGWPEGGVTIDDYKRWQQRTGRK